MPGSREKPRTPANEAAACREAGHAVAAWDLQVMLMPISIFANGRGAGRNVWNQALRNVDFEWVRTADSQTLVERLAAVVLAGPVAQRVFATRAPRGAACKKRVEEVRQLLVTVPAGGRESRERFARVENRMKKFFTRKDVRTAVSDLGQSLLHEGTLTAGEATKIIERNLRR